MPKALPTDKSSPERKPVTITVDSRESASQIPRLLGAMPHVTLLTEQLDEGDYIPGPGVIVERKAASDFISSILDGRLMSQAQLMKANHDQVIFVVEGDLRTRRSQIPDEALRGALSYLAVLLRCTVIPTDNPVDTAHLVARMASHIQHGLGYEVPLQTSKPRDLRPCLQFVVEALPGVGPGRAHALLEQFGTVQAVLAATHEQLSTVPGIGPKTASRIREVLTTPWRSAPS